LTTKDTKVHEGGKTSGQWSVASSQTTLLFEMETAALNVSKWQPATDY